MTTVFTQTRIETDNSSYRKGRDKTNSATTLRYRYMLIKRSKRIKASECWTFKSSDKI